MSLRDQIEEHYDHLFSIAIKRTEDRQDAEDLLHDACVRALRYEDSYTEEGRFVSWMATIIHNTHTNEWKRQKKERAGLEKKEAEPVGCEWVERMPWEQKAAFSRYIHEIEEIVNNDDMFEVLKLWIAGQKYKEIAEAIDRPMGTVMSRLYRARRAIKQSGWRP